MNGQSDEMGRPQQYKHNNRREDQRRQRGEEQVQIRKKKGQELLKKRRNLCELILSKSNKYGAASLSEVPDAEGLFESIKNAIADGRSIEEIVQSGVLPIIVQALSAHQEQIQCDAITIISGIVAGTPEQTKAVTDLGAVDPLLAISVSGNRKRARGAVNCLSNIAGTSAELRDTVMQSKLIQKAIRVWILSYIDSHPALLSWTLSNLVTYPDFPVDFAQFFLTSVICMFETGDDNSQQYTLQVLRTLCKNAAYLVKIRELGVLNKLTFWLPSKCLTLPILKLFREQETIMTTRNVATIVSLVNSSESLDIKRECLEFLCYLIKSSKQQSETIIETDFVPMMIDILKNGIFDLQKTAVKFLYQLSYRGYPNQIKAMLPVVPALCKLLINNKCPDVLEDVLETIKVILFTTKNYDPYNMKELVDTIDENGGLERFYELQGFETMKIVSLAASITDQYFYRDDDAEMPTSLQEASPSTTCCSVVTDVAPPQPRLWF